MTPFELVEPASLDEAIALLDAEDPTVRPIAGGTALMLMMKAGVFRPTRLVSLRKLAARYSRVAAGKDGALTIGAMTPLAVVERSPEVARAAPVITRTMRRLSNIRVRNVATIGGNLAHGDPHMDLPPVLIALRAEVAVMGREGARTRHLGRTLDHRERGHGADGERAILPRRDARIPRGKLAQAHQSPGTKYARLHHQHVRGAAGDRPHGGILGVEQSDGFIQRSGLNEFERSHVAVSDVDWESANAARMRSAKSRSISLALARSTGWPRLPSLPVSAASIS